MHFHYYVHQITTKIMYGRFLLCMIRNISLWQPKKKQSRPKISIPSNVLTLQGTLKSFEIKRIHGNPQVWKSEPLPICIDLHPCLIKLPYRQIARYFLASIESPILSHRTLSTKVILMCVSFLRRGTHANWIDLHLLLDEASLQIDRQIDRQIVFSIHIERPILTHRNF